MGGEGGREERGGRRGREMSSSSVPSSKHLKMLHITTNNYL